MDSQSTVYVGIELAASSIRVAASTGQRVTISGARGQDPNEWLELALYGLSGLSDPVYGCVAVPVDVTPAECDAITQAGRNGRFAGLFTCRAPQALVRGADLDVAVGIVLDAKATSVALVRDRTFSGEDEDHVRPIAGREAREIAIAVRCLLKRHPRDVQRTLLRSVLVGGDEGELDRIGRNGLFRELEGLGGQVTLLADPFVPAVGAADLAAELDHDSWRRLALGLAISPLRAAA